MPEEEAHNAAALAYEQASDRYEAALQRPDQAQRERARQELRNAADVEARTLAELVAARRREAVPSFTTLLTDPTIQPDPTGDVLRSIEEYRNAKPASAGVPLVCADCGVTFALRDGRGRVVPTLHVHGAVFCWHGSMN